MMKYFTLLISLSFFATAAFAQNAVGADTALKFDKRFTKCERKWVVISKRDTARQYLFGFIYIDMQAGFTFDLKGRFSIDKDGHYIADTTATKTGSVKVRIAPNWRPVALLPPAHFRELKIKAEPDWVKIYYPENTNTVYHDYRMGYVYNAADDSETALTYLKKAYSVSPHPDGVEFELAYAYNALKQYDDAIKILNPAIASKPPNALLYKELAYAYSHKNDYDDAIDTYKKGLTYFPDAPSDSKGEMALNMASIYKAMGNQEEFKNWMAKAKIYVVPNSAYYKQIVAAGF